MGKRRPLRVDAVLDIEAESWDRFVIGGLKTRETFRSYNASREKNLVDAVLDVDGDVWCHYGGRYDSLWFLEQIAKRGIRAKVTIAGARVLCVEVGGTFVRDSWAICPISLKSSAAISGVKKEATGLPCICPGLSSCGGYCSISSSMDPKLLAKLAGYLEHDCDATWELVERIIGYCDENEIELRSTIGASAWATASKMCGIGPADDFTRREYKFLREGYFGGRVQVFRPRAAHGRRYDINSAYPASLINTSLPTGDREWLESCDARDAYWSGREGILNATVEVPESFVPPLPVRADDRTAYPFGRFNGTWTALELRYAEEHGAQIEEIFDGVFWSDSAPLLRRFCEWGWDLRASEGPKSGMGQWLKLLLNSLTGKFAQRPQVETVLINPSEIKDCPGEGSCRDECDGMCGAMYPIGDSDRIYTKKHYRFAPSGHIHFSAYLTADTRTRQLHSQWISTGDGSDLVYGDTDSCFTTTERGGVGKDIGEWDDEGSFFDFHALAPKTYHYFDEDGVIHAASKGIPDPSRNWDRIVDGESIEVTRGVLGFKSAARKGSLFQRKHESRAVRADGRQFGDRILRSDGLTYPQDVRFFRNARKA